LCAGLPSHCPGVRRGRTHALGIVATGFLPRPSVEAIPREGTTTLARRPYEAVLILNPNVEEPELAAVQEKVLGQITARGGEVSRVDTWGRRRMFYPIKHQRDGHYLVCHFHADAPAIKQIETQWLITDGLLRHLVIRLDED
jgi:small subunit ribosomal protein S6